MIVSAGRTEQSISEIADIFWHLLWTPTLLTILESEVANYEHLMISAIDFWLAAVTDT